MAKKSADYAVESEPVAPTPESIAALESLAAAAQSVLHQIDLARPALALWTEAEAAVARARDQLSSVTTSAKTLEGEQMRWEAQRGAEIQQHHAKLEEYRQKVESDLLTKQRAYEDTAAALKQQIRQLEQERDAMQPDIAHLRTTIADLRATLASLKAGIPS